MSDKLIEAVAKAICQSNIDANSAPKPNSVGFFRTTIDGPLWMSFTPDAQIVLAAIEASGYRVVPKEPTEAMIKHAKAWGMVGGERVIWDAMLAAAPKVTP